MNSPELPYNFGKENYRNKFQSDGNIYIQIRYVYDRGKTKYVKTVYDGNIR